MSAARPDQLPAGARALRREREYTARAEKPLGADGGALQRLAALYRPTGEQQPAAELGEPIRPHRELYVASTAAEPCLGMLCEVDRDGTVIVLRCDECGHETSFKPETVDRDLRVAGILRRACLPARFVDEPLPSFEGTRAARSHAGQVVERWGTPDAPRPPFLFGPFGRGKTHLLTRIARQLVERHEVRVRYCTMRDLLAEQKAAMDAARRDPRADTVTAVFDRAARVELLVLDDLKELTTDWQLDVFERLIDARYRGRPAGDDTPFGLPVMGATNVDIDDWPQAFGGANASRLLELTHPVEVHGPDWRRT